MNRINHIKHMLQREPLTYFLALGGLIFLVNHGIQNHSRDDKTIVISAQVIELLKTRLAADRAENPAQAALDAALEQFIDDEILMRHARSLGFDQSDPVIQRRLIQKARIAIEDAAPVHEPTISDLEAYFVANREHYWQPARVSFQHVFLPHGLTQSARSDCGQLKHQLQEGAVPAKLGKPFALGRQKTLQTVADIERIFGRRMAEQLFLVPTDDWTGPYDSRYGCHIVQVSERTPGHIPAFAELRERLAQDWTRAQRDESNREALEKLRQGFKVIKLDHSLPARDTQSP